MVYAQNDGKHVFSKKNFYDQLPKRGEGESGKHHKHDYILICILMMIFLGRRLKE